MKIFLFSIFLACLLPVMMFAQGRGNSVCNESPKVSTGSENLILTVCNHTYGMAPLIQPQLYFRLFSDGRAEYEVLPAYENDANLVLIIKEIRVAKNDVEAIIKLVRQSDFQNAQEEYPKFQMWTDSSLKTTITARMENSEKKIVINNYSVWDKNNRKHYPAALLALLETVDKLRTKS